MPKAITRQSVLIATDEKTFETIQMCIGKAFHITRAQDRKECLEKISQKRYEFAFIDIRIVLEEDHEQNTYNGLLAEFWKTFPTTEIIIIAGRDKIREAVYAVKAGASNYITSPVSCEEVVYVTEWLQEEIKTKIELDYLRDQFWEKEFLHVIQTRSPVMKTIFEKVRSVAPTQTTVMIYGETGTGKGVIAQLIHAHSNRRGKQFISLHCGAIPDTLIESELFGHEKGAFTGAEKRKRGKFEIAQDGTMFLDEIGTISKSAQIKLLQVLQDRVFYPIGSEVAIEAKTRFIAASNIDLRQSVEDGDFRKDLYYRLNVFPIEIPPLRERIEDIPLLVEFFLDRLNTFYGKEIKRVHPLVVESFEKYAWPGNIRELENIIERAHILETSNLITPESIPGDLFEENPVVSQVHVNTSKTINEIRRMGIENIERQYLKELLGEKKGRINESARQAGITTRQLHKLLQKYNT